MKKNMSLTVEALVLVVGLGGLRSAAIQAQVPPVGEAVCVRNCGGEGATLVTTHISRRKTRAGEV